MMPAAWTPPDFYWVWRQVWIKTAGGGADCELESIDRFATCAEAFAVAIGEKHGVVGISLASKTLGKLFQGSLWPQSHSADGIAQEIEKEVRHA